MHKLLTYISLLVMGLSFSPTLMYAVEEVVEASQEEMDAYYSKLKGEVKKSQERVAAILKQAQSKDVIQVSIRSELQRAMSTLDAKRILYGNFVDTESLKKSPAIRERLLKVFKKKDITESDLAGLQSLVIKEKEKLGIAYTNPIYDHSYELLGKL